MGMLITRRLLTGLVVVIGASVVVFLVLHEIPGDPVAAKLQGAPATPALIAQIRASLGLNKSLPAQYWMFVSDALHGNLGTSYVGDQPVSSLLLSAVPSTLALTGASLLIGAVGGGLLGIVSAVTAERWPDAVIRSFSSLCAAMPVFWTGTLLLLVFSFTLRWFPGIGGTGLPGLVLPALSLGLASAGVLSRVVRASMLEILQEPFVHMLSAKGLGRQRILVPHVARSALVPVIAVLGLQFGEALAGAVVTETVFSRTGIGRLLVTAIENKDYPIVQGVMVFIAVGLVLVNIVVDLSQVLIDPRAAWRRPGCSGATVRQLLTATAVYQEFPGPAWTPGAVLTEGNRIVAAGPAAELTALAGEGSTRIDLGSAVVTPGFIDAHVHLCFDASDDPVGRLSQATASGRDSGMPGRDRGQRGRPPGGRRHHRQRPRGPRAARRPGTRADQGRLPGPDLLLACQPLTTPRGHCWYMGGECAGTAELIAAVHARRHAGAEWIKLMVSGGFLTDGTVPAQPQFDLATLRAVTDAAHAEGLRVAAHAHSTRAIRAAALAGVDTIEHATFIAPDGIDFDPELADLLAEQRIAICPTANAATASYPARYGTEALGRISQLHAAGVPVIMGTDAGVRQVPGRRYADGLLALHQAGFTAADVLAAATAAAADALGLTAITGRLLPGLRADLVALPGDPLRDITVARNPLLVMTNGMLARPAAKTPSPGAQ